MEDINWAGVKEDIFAVDLKETKEIDARTKIYREVPYLLSLYRQGTDETKFVIGAIMDSHIDNHKIEHFLDNYNRSRKYGYLRDFLRRLEGE
jgi:hypothetical protein